MKRSTIGATSLPGSGAACPPSRPIASAYCARQVTTRWIIAKLRNIRFFSLVELNAAIRDCVTALNDRVSRHLGASRRALFEALDQPALKPLPTEPYVYAEWKQCRAGLDYHVEVAKHYYSVPHALLREELWARITAHTVELFHRGNRVAVHVRSSSNRKHTTVREHMPALCRLDAGPHPGSSERDRAEDIGADRDHPAREDASGAGLPRHDRHPQARQQLRA